MEPKLNEAEVTSQVGKKRILFIITQAELGGAQQFLVQLIRYLNKSLFECTIIAGEGEQEIKTLLPDHVSYSTAKHLVRDPNIKDDILSLFELKKIIKHNNPDILFLNSSKAGFNGSLAAKMAGIPKLKVIYRIGGWTFNDPWPNWKKLLFRLLEKISAPWKDYIIVNSSLDLKAAHIYGIKPRRQVQLIHNGIDPYLEFLTKEEARVKLLEKISKENLTKNQGGQGALLQSEIIIGSIANFYPPKDLTNLLKAAVQLPDKTVLVIIGEGQLRPQIEEEIEKLNLKNKVFLAGRIKDAYKYLPAFDIFALPSNKEGFPWVLLEAAAAKIPIVSTSVGAVPEIIEHNKSGFIVESKNPTALAEALRALIGDERIRKEFSIQAHQQLLKNFTLQQMIGKYENLFISP